MGNRVGKDGKLLEEIIYNGYLIIDNKNNLIGEGGFAWVLRIKRVSDGKSFAMKITFLASNAMEMKDLQY